MNKSIRKFINILKESYMPKKTTYQENMSEDINKEKIEDEYKAFGLIMWLDDDFHIQKHKFLSDNFNYLVKEILKAINNGIKFNDREITDILLGFIHKNINNGILEEKEIVKCFSSRDTKGYWELSNELKGIMKKDKYDIYTYIFNTDIKNVLFNPNENYMINTSRRSDKKHIIECHQKLKEHYFDKRNTYTKEDVDIIVSTLISLGLHAPMEEIIELTMNDATNIIGTSVRNTLLTKLEQRKKPQKEVEIKRVEREQKPILTKKQYHEIKNELDSKFDFIRMEPLINVTLTPEEIEYCINLMNQLSFTDREKEIFLEKSFKKSREEILNIDSIMNLLQSQIEFYNINNETVNKAMENLELYIEEYKNTEDQIEKEEWFELIKEEIRIVNTFIPRTFEYEKSMLLQKRVN